MKYVIDEDVCTKFGLTLEEMFALLLVKASNGKATEVLNSLWENNVLDDLHGEGEILIISNEFDDRMCKILLESETTIPKQDRCESLAVELRALFPKGMKYGSAAWRGNIREVALKLQKFFKLYGNKWTDEEIINATKRYVEAFNGNYTYMRILKYFILKNTRKINEDGVGFVEETSDLATCLENPEDIKNIDWTVDIR